MEIKRFFVDNGTILSLGTSKVVTGEEFTHAVKVCRYKVGYKLILSNGDGYDYFSTVTSIDKSSFTCRVDERKKNENELKKRLILYLCAIERSDLAVQKATEIGASEIRLMISVFTNAKKQNLDRLNKIALESAKQCGRALVPKIYEPIPYEEAIRDAVTRADQTIFCYECAKEGRIADVMDPQADCYALVVGSEGGFSAEEVALAERLGAKVVTLGRRILRAETACIAGLALLADEAERNENSGN
ncbi:MAG: 16S rRNA (uracil(1498)-N(3))-methyltransferase [Clostridia bacterium]|nr:16S rRNA (uracil(1498)-N(3))-methyltransferase [Clostridia bacterium]